MLPKMVRLQLPRKQLFLDQVLQFYHQKKGNYPQQENRQSSRPWKESKSHLSNGEWLCFETFSLHELAILQDLGDLAE